MRLLQLLPAILVLLAAPARAADALKLSTEAFQEVETVAADGRRQKKLVPAARVVPGNEVVYVITYRNVGAQPATQVVINNPVPKELIYQDGSARAAGAAVEVSVDQGRTYGTLARLRVTGADGRTRPAQPADVTHVRWTLAAALQPGDTGKVTYRATLR